MKNELRSRLYGILNDPPMADWISGICAKNKCYDCVFRCHENRCLFAGMTQVLERLKDENVSYTDTRNTVR